MFHIHLIQKLTSIFKKSNTHQINLMHNDINYVKLHINDQITYLPNIIPN
jgi:hypothetical protein